MKTTVFLKLLAAVPLDGVLHGAGAVVPVSEDLAVNLLNRGKAEVATEADLPAPTLEDMCDAVLASTEPPAAETTPAADAAAPAAETTPAEKPAKTAK